jgi:hypothetical protein
VYSPLQFCTMGGGGVLMFYKRFFFLQTDWLFIVLRPTQEYFTYMDMDMSPLPVKGCKIYACARRSGPLCREGFLSCHTCCDTGPRFFRSHPKDRPIQLPLTTHKGMWKIYSNPNPQGSVFYRCAVLKKDFWKLMIFLPHPYIT